MSNEIITSSERKSTNIGALISACFLLGTTLALVFLCFIVSSIQLRTTDLEDTNETQQQQILKDGCGNICGQNNTQGLIICGDPNKLNQSKLLIHKSPHNETENFEKHSECVKNCPIGYDDISNICIESIESDFGKTMRILKASWYCILIMSIVAFFSSFLFLTLFHYKAKCAILFINIGFIIVCILSFIFFAVPGFYGYATPFLIIGIGLSGYLIWYRDKIEYVGGLFVEASRVLFDVPLLGLVPIMTLISLAIVSAIYITFLIIIDKVDEDNPISRITYWFNTISYLFIIQFITGCQNFIIAGVVCRWFFVHEKTELEEPFKKSFSDLRRFHLGSVCVGAFLMTIWKILRRTTKVVKEGFSLINADCLILNNLLEKIFIYLCSNAYVIVAKEGKPFTESGQRAYKLLKDNIKDAFTLNTVGDVSLFACKVLTTYAAGLVGYILLNQKSEEFGEFFTLPLIIGCILAFLIARCLILVFEITVDAVFICTCIDKEDNVAKNNESFMSKRLAVLLGRINVGFLPKLKKIPEEEAMVVGETII